MLLQPMTIYKGRTSLSTLDFEQLCVISCLLLFNLKLTLMALLTSGRMQPTLTTRSNVCDGMTAAWPQPAAWHWLT